jgi:hypothetical protein
MGVPAWLGSGKCPLLDCCQLLIVSYFAKRPLKELTQDVFCNSTNPMHDGFTLMK